jgi:hypothetical protein
MSSETSQKPLVLNLTPRKLMGNVQVIQSQYSRMSQDCRRAPSNYLPDVKGRCYEESRAIADSLYAHAWRQGKPYPVSARSIKSLNHPDSRLTPARDHNERHCFGFRTEDIRSIWVWSQAWSIRLCRGYRFEFGSSIGWDACNRTAWC